MEGMSKLRPEGAFEMLLEALEVAKPCLTVETAVCISGTPKPAGRAVVTNYGNSSVPVQHTFDRCITFWGRASRKVLEMKIDTRTIV